ncbi:HAD-IA family hydrolase [Shewanella colwelliana]|uniref:HAD family hydrolase n=1 Tax=Shewanella colwelliana TaxID=23 RepID=UPI0022AEF9EB|nr:HAD-IA family hydrolase [Shewanella colwelliana]MCZ4338129.1 HAD-IA family hydrolase [Shewanella colwelliana]
MTMRRLPAIKGVLFDLDGTLVDTAPDLVAALNLALEEYGYPQVALSAIRDEASNGSMALVNAAQPHLDDVAQTQLQQALLKHYGQVNGQQAIYFNGVKKLIDFLVAEQIPFGIVTNKAACFARPLLHHLGLIPLMPAVVSGDSVRYTKPHPAPMLLAAQQIGVNVAQILYLGDALRDLQAAQNSGMQGGIAQWGYIGQADNSSEWPHDFSFDNPDEIIALLKAKLK